MSNTRRTTNITRLGLTAALVAAFAAHGAAADLAPVCDTWNSVPAPVTGKANALSAVDVLDASNVWAIGREWNPAGTREGAPLVVRWSNSSWAVEPLPDLSHLGSFPALEAIHIAVTGDPWVVGRLQDAQGNDAPLILQSSGGLWQAHPVAMLNSFAPRYAAFRDVTSLSQGDAWAVGEARTMSKGAVEPFTAHWDGSSWSEVYVPAAPGRSRSVTAVSAAGGSVWAVGHDFDGETTKTANARIFRWDGRTWSEVDHPVADKPGAVLHDIVALSASDVWAVGVIGDEEGGLFLHWDGSSWTSHAAPLSSNPRSVDGVSSDDVWALGAKGLSHWDGSTWTLHPSGTGDMGGPRRVTVAVAGPCEAWLVAAGNDASVIQRLGPPEPAPAPEPIPSGAPSPSADDVPSAEAEPVGPAENVPSAEAEPVAPRTVESDPVAASPRRPSAPPILGGPITAAPETPTDVVAKPADEKSISLGWVAGSDPNGADDTTFVIERCTGGPDGCLTEVAVIAKVQGQTWFLDSGLQPATPYTYRIYAVNRSGESDRSAPVTGFTRAPETQSPGSVPEASAEPAS